MQRSGKAIATVSVSTAVSPDTHRDARRSGRCGRHLTDPEPQSQKKLEQDE